MRTNRHKWIVLAAFILAAATVASAQEREGRKPPRRQNKAQAAQRENHPRERAAPAQLQAVWPKAARDAQIALVSLSHAHPESLTKVLLELRPALGEPILVVPDDHTRTLVIAAETEQALEKVRDLIDALDRPAGGEVAHDHGYHLVTLKHAVAKEVVHHLVPLLPRRHDLRLVADERANTVWLTGPPDLAERTVQMIERMEDSAAAAEAQASARPGGLRFYEVQHAHVDELAETVHRVAAMMKLNARVAADTASNMLIVYATPAALEPLETVIEKLDVPPKHAGQPGEPQARVEDPDQASGE